MSLFLQVRQRYALMLTLASTLFIAVGVFIYCYPSLPPPSHGVKVVLTLPSGTPLPAWFIKGVGGASIALGCFGLAFFLPVLLGWQALGVLIDEAGITHVRGWMGNTLLPWEHIKHITLDRQGVKTGWGHRATFIHVQLATTFSPQGPSMGQPWMYRLNNSFMGTKHAYSLSAQGLSCNLVTLHALLVTAYATWQRHGTLADARVTLEKIVKQKR